MAAKKTAAAAKPRAKTTKTAGRKLALNLPAPAAPSKPAPAATAQPAPAAASKPTTVNSPVPGSAAPKAEARPAPRPVPARAAREPLETGQEVIDTYLACGTIAARGVESIGKEVVSFARASAQAQFDLTEALVHAKSLEEAIEAHNVFTFESLDTMAAEWTKLAGLSMGLTQEIMEPIHSRVSDHARGFWLPLAA